MGQRYSRTWHERGPKGGNPTDGKGMWGSVRSPFLMISGNGAIVGEISGNHVNDATSQLDLSDISGGFLWKQKLTRRRDCHIVIDAGFNGWLRSFDWLRKYLGYMKSSHPKANLVKTDEKLLLGIAFGGHQGRESTMGTVIPIWTQWNSKPAPVTLIRGKTELLRGMDIIRKLDIAVRLGGDRFKVGQSEWEWWPLMRSVVVYFL